jgi:hypothetical protein
VRGCEGGVVDGPVEVESESRGDVFSSSAVREGRFSRSSGVISVGFWLEMGCPVVVGAAELLECKWFGEAEILESFSVYADGISKPGNSSGYLKIRFRVA